jgi:mRNA deadenylase 3'-5' endonuclease subunit Ccr4
MSSSAASPTTTTTSTTPTATTLTNSVWNGHVIVRVLPANVCQDYHQNRPVARQVDPALLQQQHQHDQDPSQQYHPEGALRDRMVRPRIAALSADLLEAFSLSTLSSFQPPSTTRTTTSATPKSAIEQITTLSVYLYKNANETTNTANATAANNETNPTLFIQLHRNSDEPVHKTLNRMQLSVAKKLQFQSRKTIQAATGGSSQAATFTSTNTNTSAGPTLWKVHPDTGVALEPVDMSTRTSSTNRTVWTDAIATPLAVTLDIANTASSTTSNDKDDDTGTTLQLLIESCPPTVTAVHTFGDFDASLFCHVPLRVDVDLLYSTAAVVDWYVDGQCVARNCTVFVPREQDADKHVAVVIRPTRDTHSGRGCEEAYQFLQTVQPLPANTLLQLRPSWTAPRNTNGEDVRVVTYNILADQNAFSSNQMPVYPYCPREFLEKYRRMPLILHELLSYQADVLCLQEVDEAVYYALFQPILQHYGYQGYYSCKASAGNREGCAVFWQSSRFHDVPLEDQKTHVLRDLFPYQSLTRKQDTDNNEDNDWTSMKDMTALLERRRDLRHIVQTKLGHVAQIVPLTCRLTGRRLTVTNTHLFYHPIASHVRLMQMYVLCRQLAREIEKKDSLVILCGDMNTSLRNSAGRLLTERHVPANHRDLQAHLDTFQWGPRGTRLSAAISASTLDFPAFSLPESFPVLQPALKEAPSFTHYIVGFFGTLDHILTGPGLECRAAALMPAVRDVARDTAMPSERLPSDHVSLVCDLSLSTITAAESKE